MVSYTESQWISVKYSECFLIALFFLYTQLTIYEHIVTRLASIRSKSKGWWARNQNNVSEWSDIYRLVLVCQHYKSPGKRVGLVQRGYHH
jgi:hypothetical protein